MKKTLLAAMALLSLGSYAQLTVQHFDNPWTGTPAAPPEWLVNNVGGTGVTWEQSPAGSTIYPAYGNSGQAALLKIDTEPATNPVQEDWLITNVVPIGLQPVSLHFFSRLLLDGNQGSNYRVLYALSVADPAVPSNFTELQSWSELTLNPNQLQYTEKTITLPPQLAGTLVRFAFVMAGSNADGWLVDNIQLTADCLTPTNLTATMMTDNIAALGWANPSGAASWEIEVVTANSTPAGVGVMYSGQLPYTVMTLVPGESYKYYVRALCQDGGKSAWAGPLYFPEDTCPVPTDVEIASFDTVSTVYTWTSTGAITYDYWLTTTNSIPNASTIPTGSVVSNTVTLSGLDISLDYKLYVRSNCGLATVSAWSTLPEPVNTMNNTIHGTVMYDSNADGICNEDDAPLAYAEVQFTVNDLSFSIYTNQNGEYSLYNFQDGTYTLNLQVVSPVFSSIAPLVQEVLFTEEINDVEVNHCLGQPNAVNDLAVTIVPAEVARPGFNATYNVVIHNAGSLTVEDVVLNLTFDNTRITYANSGFSGVTASAGSLSIPIGDVQPFSATEGSVTFSVMVPPTNIGGENLYFEASLSEVANDIKPDNNEAVLNQIIVNSYDPNDITVHEGAEIYADQADDYLTYTIRFQNTGTAEAVNIRLENTLDALLDWSTFTPIASSHAYSAKRTNDVIEFDYKDIFLPDNTANEPQSHGYVTYRIKPTAEYGLGDTVYNKAEIYFDFNEAIHTNTAETKVVEITAGLTDSQIAIAKVYPNPVKDQLHIAIQLGELQLVTVHDINGRLCFSANAEIIDTAKLTAGIYFVKVTTDAGSADYKIIKH